MGRAGLNGKGYSQEEEGTGLGRATMRPRSWPLLSIAFGSLIFLIVVSAVSAMRQVRLIYDQVLGQQERDRRVERSLSQIRSEIQMSGIFVRDYLLDPAQIRADFYRTRLVECRAATARELEALRRMLGTEEAGRLASLESELDAYWDSYQPLFEWSARQKLALSSIFLKQQVLPKRDAVLEIAREVRKLYEAHRQSQEDGLRIRQQQFGANLVRGAGIAVSLGLVVAVFSLVRISRLERRNEEQRQHTEQAENEMRRLSHQLVRAQEEERKTISRELHDEIGQMLTALRMELGRLDQRRLLPPDEFEQDLLETKRLAEEALRTVRDLAMGLRPSMLDDLGLGPALEWQVREFSRRSGVPAQVQLEGMLEGLPDRSRTAVYRIVQEALTNCARHAHAREIRVNLYGHRDGLTLTIQDDGVGFQDADARGRGLGLIGIEERVRELGGQFDIFSQPGKGTVLRVNLPAAEAAAA